ncbi:STING domain-containing protein [Labilibaculum manganireducens]|uniref:STING domain-containing protein n=1 Tax=Labilibaculum manganireducens TaxID=1940525 RepID=UPI0029F518DC|nr:STING domain-containing protein [Labilibaculum manganireducens]
MKSIKYTGIALQVILYSFTIGLAIIWFFKLDTSFDVEAGTFILLGIISPSITFVINKYSNKIEAEKFSTANALAHGYIENFVEPIITQLLKKGNSPSLYIYIPEKLSDLYPKNIDRIKARLTKKKLSIETKSVKLNEGRANRDIMTISGLSNDVYFDIPNTLLTLNPLIDFRINSPKNNLSEKEKDELGCMYILAFKETALKLINTKGLNDNIKLIDENLQFN